MPLPKLNSSLYELFLPLSNKKINFRPFTVEEEKILLLASESKNSESIINSMKQIINNCVIDNIDVGNLSLIELQFIFLNLRAKSTGEEIVLKLKHENGINSNGEQCAHEQEININIEEIKIEKHKEHTNKFQLDDNVGVVLKYPTIEDFSIIEENGNELDSLLKIVGKCIETIYDKENVYEAIDCTDKEIFEFVNSMNQQQLNKVKGFFDTMPSIKHNISYVCNKCGCNESTTIEGYQNFF